MSKAKHKLEFTTRDERGFVILQRRHFRRTDLMTKFIRENNEAPQKDRFVGKPVIY